jgi:cell division septation protein DedD
MKIVITASKSSITIGLQKADCDPQFYQVKDLLGAVKGIPVFLGMATKVWAKSPRYPKAVEVAPAAMKPAASASTQAKTQTTTSSTTSPKSAPVPKPQPGMPGL